MARQHHIADQSASPASDGSPLRVLWVGTKPPLPSTDGGRLVSHLTISALRAAGVDVTVVVPGAEDGRPRRWSTAILVGAATGAPATLVRHARPAVGRRVARLVASTRFDVVHVEQLQALAASEPARRAGLPIVLRMHNVESAVWTATASPRSWWPPAWVRRREAVRLRDAERQAFERVDAVVALSEDDRRECAGIAPGASIEMVPPPMPLGMATSGQPLPGDPACVWLGSVGWTPNDLARRWLLDVVWPAIAAARPGAVLHVFGGTPTSMAGIEIHPAPTEADDAFAPDSVILLPLPMGAGVRMRLLDAWARGVPVVATREACRGLAAVDGENVLLADTPQAFGAAVSRLASDPAPRQHIIAGGQATVAAHHDPATVAASLVSVYRTAIARQRG